MAMVLDDYYVYVACVHCDSTGDISIYNEQEGKWIRNPCEYCNGFGVVRLPKNKVPIRSTKDS